ncbi:MAG: hypothetical protein EBY18_17295, partial [Alphaproteobacteria bacterium]|nr:hypothetical protein [Alphaproteobacteria bacterium]
MLPMTEVRAKPMNRFLSTLALALLIPGVVAAQQPPPQQPPQSQATPMYPAPPPQAAPPVQ